ncbi:hypothetical protein BM1_09988 [Bipolaris maydis]|nr:hypothetical protein BM1_09988 [Bipolaris maydis]
MPQQQNAILTQQEGRLTLAVQAYRTGQFKSIRRAAAAYNVHHQQISRRLQGITFRPTTQPNRQKLTKSEEQTIVRYILNLDSRGFAPRLCEVADMAEKLLRVRDGQPLGKNWAERFVSLRETIKKYGVHSDNIHNFDETSFQMGVIGSMKVVTGAERRTRPTLTQPGNREWVTVIQSICATEYTTPPFIIYKGRVHIST